MIPWQFWTLIGIISVFGIYILASLSELIKAVSNADFMSNERFGGLRGALHNIYIDINAIKQKIDKT